MKDLVMTHYFLGLEVWKYPDEIFLNQGKHTVEILKIFGMIDCKAMTTLMTTNLKLLNDNSSEIVDVTLYKQNIGFPMYLINTRPTICFVVNTLSHYMVNPIHIHLVEAKTCDEVPKGDFRLWSQICIRWKDHITWIYIFKLGRKFQR